MSLDLGAARAWLLGPDVLRDDGAVMSWANPAHPGYPYPEIAGLWLSAFPAHAGAARVAGWLRAQVDASARVGRGAVRYAFDTAVALRGLLAVAPADDLTRAMAARLREDLRARTACVGATETRWSTVAGPHLLKCAIALGDNEIDAAPFAREDRAGLRFDDGTGSGRTYLHAHLYALEGARWLAARGDREAHRWLHAGLRWTAAAQDDSGALRAWHDGSRAEGPLRADATAQALRLWVAVDRARFAREIDAARRFLRAAQHPSGGVRYEPGGDDVNTWATLFAAQAERWFAEGVTEDPL